MQRTDYLIWFSKSKDNLKWAEDNLGLGNFPLTCYLSQQAIELLLKGYLYSKNIVSPKTHQLLKLAKICKENGFDLTKYTKELAILSEYYFESRYPDGLNED